jgi:hypothetical protein
LRSCRVSDGCQVILLRRCLVTDLETCMSSLEARGGPVPKTQAKARDNTLEKGLTLPLCVCVKLSAKFFSLGNLPS